MRTEKQMFHWAPRIRKQEIIHSTLERFWDVRLVIRQDRFARCKPVVTQNKIRGKAIGSTQREVRVVNTVIGGGMEVGGGDSGTRNPKRTWRVKPVNKSWGDSRAFGRRVKENRHWRLVNECRNRCGGHRCRRRGWREQSEGHILFARSDANPTGHVHVKTARCRRNELRLMLNVVPSQHSFILKVFLHKQYQTTSLALDGRGHKGHRSCV